MHAKIKNCIGVARSLLQQYCACATVHTGKSNDCKMATEKQPTEYSLLTLFQTHFSYGFSRTIRPAHSVLWHIYAHIYYAGNVTDTRTCAHYYVRTYVHVHGACTRARAVATELA